MHNIPIKKLRNGFELPVYGLGLSGVGGGREIDITKDTEEVAAIQTAIEQGITHIDTAEGYGRGHSEELLGQAITGCNRSILRIASKVSPDNQSYDGVYRSIDASLARLGTDYIDLYLLHRYPLPGICIADTTRALGELMTQRVIRNIGVCNMSRNRMEAVQKHLEHPIVCNQVHYNVQYREAEARGVLTACQQKDTMLVAYRPMQQGELSCSSFLNSFVRAYNKTPAQIAINWLISQANVVTICKTSQVHHLTENLGAVNWEMQSHDIERIRKEFPDQCAISNVLPLDYTADIAP